MKRVMRDNLTHANRYQWRVLPKYRDRQSGK